MRSMGLTPTRAWAGLDGFFAARLGRGLNVSPLASTRRGGYLGRILGGDRHPRLSEGLSASMSRGSIADRTRLAAFAARRAFSTGMGRLNAHPMLRWRFSAGA